MLESLRDEKIPTEKKKWFSRQTDFGENFGVNTIYYIEVVEEKMKVITAFPHKFCQLINQFDRLFVAGRGNLKLQLITA